MKKIITMVGTSIFDNYLEHPEKDSMIRNYCQDLEDKRAKDFDSERNRIQKIKEAIQKWMEQVSDKKDLCAEIKSLIKIKEELKDNFEIYLLSSDTILSKLAAELIKEFLPTIGFGKNIHPKVINDLQMWDREAFTRGLVDLINKLYQIANEYWDDVIINITGGYKATIPYLTILAQVNRCPIYYIFEKTDALIKIPYIPLDIKKDVFEKNESLFDTLEREKISEIRSVDPDVQSLLEKADNLYSFNPLGIVLWERYKQKFAIFYVSDLFENYIKNSNYQPLAHKSLLELKRRMKENPNDPDLDHRLKDVDLQSFKCFKHKESNKQVRILYKSEERETTYGSKEFDLYVGLIRIGSDVHNVESEYVEDFRKNIQKIKDTTQYKLYKIIKQEVQNV